MNTLQNQVTGQGKNTQCARDSLTQLSNSLSQTAADIDASGKMPGNLIVNGSFERGAAGFYRLEQYRDGGRFTGSAFG